MGVRVEGWLKKSSHKEVYWNCRESDLQQVVTVTTGDFENRPGEVMRD